MSSKKNFYTYAEAQAALRLLGIKTRTDYITQYRKDPRLPSAPSAVYANAGWSNWYDYLGNQRASYYAAYKQAQAAAQALGATTRSDYIERRREDGQLPANPNRFYAGAGWSDWYDFLGTERPDHYRTYAEARSAVKALGIKTRAYYQIRYQEDRRLPSSPDGVYAKLGWSGWSDFFDNERCDRYSTYAEAQTAVKLHGFKSQSEYRKFYQRDRRLPANPNKVYAGSGWSSWYDFLGTERPEYYGTYAEAHAAVLARRITTQVSYKTHSKIDRKLPSDPSRIYAESGWSGWDDFFSLERRELYPSYGEAQAATRALGIKSKHSYKRRHRDDRRLPPKPDKVYAGSGWSDWYDFLGTERREYYSTYAEARSAVQALEVKSGSDYKRQYRKDLRLPPYPDACYAQVGWSDWYDFLGTERRSFYATYAEAHAAVERLGVKTRAAYNRSYRKDPKLPAAPDAVYAKSGWSNWYDFLCIQKAVPYGTYAEARFAVRALGIRTQPDYQCRYREDSKLPFNPAAVYANAGWSDWYDFLDRENPNAPLAEYPVIWREVTRWLESQTGILSKKSALKSFLSNFYKSCGFPDDPKYLLFRPHPFDANVYQSFVQNQADTVRQPLHSAISAFYGWLLDEYCTDREADERLVLPDYRNPFETALTGIEDTIRRYRHSESTKPPLGYEYILRARNFLVPNGEEALRIRPNLKDLPHLQDFFNGPADWMYVDEECIDFSDPNCIWRKVEKADRRVEGQRVLVDSYQIWSPVRFVALYTLLRFPLRGQQILWLDSGEADDEVARVDPTSGVVGWTKNTGPLAKNANRARRRQGAVQRSFNGTPKLYVTTNKTGRSEGGYGVDWIPDDLVYWFLLLRDWQARYNPISEPTRWTDINLRAETNAKILKARGAQCFLFRTDSSGQPMMTTTAFTFTLPALLHAIQRPGENLASEQSGARSQSGRFVSSYTPHSLRVSLITAFVADGDAPIHLISKLVGHASLVMTIYYTKLNSEQMRRAMGESEKRAAQIASERYAETIRLRGLSPLREQLIVTDGNRALLESDTPASACVVFDWGICPMSAALCHIGGAALVERKAESVYAPVEAGHLGAKNCPRCRFFVTGVPFLGSLVAVANELALEIHTESLRFQEFAEAVERLEQDFYDSCQAGEVDTQQAKRKQVSANQQQSAAKLDGLLADYVAVNHYVQGCLKLIRDTEKSGEGDGGVRLLATGDLREIGVAFEESQTNYHLLAEICQNATIYQSSNPSRAVPLISQHIDRMAANNNLAPAMYRLSNEQKLVVINELNQLLLQRLGSWEKIDKLFSGDLMLLDIDAHEPKLKRISTEIENTLSSSTRTRQLDYKASIDE